MFHVFIFDVFYGCVKVQNDRDFYTGRSGIKSSKRLGLKFKNSKKHKSQKEVLFGKIIISSSTFEVL